MLNLSIRQLSEIILIIYGILAALYTYSADNDVIGNSNEKGRGSNKILSIDSKRYGDSNRDLQIKVISNSLEINESTNKALFLGEVKTYHGDITIYSGRMEVNFLPKSSKFEFETIKYNNNIKVKIPGYDIESDEAILNLLTKKLILKGHLVIRKDKDFLKGEILIYDIEKGLVDLRGKEENRVKAIIQVK